MTEAREGVGVIPWLVEVAELAVALGTDVTTRSGDAEPGTRLWLGAVTVSLMAAPGWSAQVWRGGRPSMKASAVEMGRMALAVSLS